MKLPTIYLEDDYAAMARRGGEIVRLGQIATIDLGPQNYNSSSAFDGVKAVFMGIQTTPDANPLTVINTVRDTMPEIQRLLPTGLEANIAYDATLFINASIWEVGKTLLEASVIVIIVIFLFLGSIRSTIIPVVTIPLSLIGGASANTFTLTGWTKDASIDGGAGKDTVVYVGDTDFLLQSDRIIAGKGVSGINTNPIGSATFMLRGMETVTLTGGASANTFTVAGFAGTVNLDGKNGSDIYNLYLNNADATTLVVKDTGTVRTDKDSVFAYATTAVPTHSTTLKRITFSMSRVDYANIELVQVLRGTI